MRAKWGCFRVDAMGWMLWTGAVDMMAMEAMGVCWRLGEGEGFDNGR